jgi:hypothetical protein
MIMLMRFRHLGLTTAIWFLRLVTRPVDDDEMRRIERAARDADRWADPRDEP